MRRGKNGDELFRVIKDEINKERMVRHVKKIGQWHRYTGTSDAEAFVDDLLLRLNDIGVSYSVEEYELYSSTPGTGMLEFDDGEQIRIVGDVYSADVSSLYGDLVYDVWAERKERSEEEEQARFHAFRDRIVLSWDSGGQFASKVYEAGGKAILHISQSNGGYIHHSNISPFWGTPGFEDGQELGKIVSSGISLEDGKRLIQALKYSPLRATIHQQMHTGLQRSRMPVVNIPGRTPQFVLISGHYDSWYEGITDNAGSDAILLELTRAFHLHQRELERSIRIAWWSGHSDARYAGSAWYCDAHWAELNKNCIASINLDLTGCRLSEQIRARTTCMEGEAFTASLIEEYTGMSAKPYIPMIRGADQSFWGTRIPIHIMFKYEPVDAKRVSPCPSGGPWWHTNQDTIDKLDGDILLRDALINAHAACRILNSSVLPVQIENYVAWMIQHLEKLRDLFPKDFDLSTTIEHVRGLLQPCHELEKLLASVANEDTDVIIKQIAGELTRLVFSTGDQYHPDRSIPASPFAAIAEAEVQVRKKPSPEHRLFIRTDFKRACNRIAGQCDWVAELINNFLLYHQNRCWRK